MNPERKEFLNLLSLPGRISATEAAWKLGFETDHITILTSAGLLKPLGHPPPGAMKFFAAVEIEQKKKRCQMAEQGQRSHPAQVEGQERTRGEKPGAKRFRIRNQRKQFP